MAEVIALDGNFDGARDRAVAELRAGRLVVVPTDTVYALVADAFDTQATLQVFAAKRQPRRVPLGVVVRTPRQVNGLVSELPDRAERLMASYWPGPLTLVFNQSDGLIWDLGETQGAIGVRMPAHEFLIAVAGEIGPLACTTARVKGGLLPYTVEQAQAQIGELAAVYIDGGELAGGVSSVVDVTRGRAVVLRSGAVSSEHIQLVATGQVPWGGQPKDPPEEDPADEPRTDAPLTDEPPAQAEG